MANFPFLSVGDLIMLFVGGVLVINHKASMATGLFLGWAAAFATCVIKFKVTGGL